MEEESAESETNQLSEGSHEISERSQRFKRRLDYAEYSNDEDEEKEPGSSKRGKKERKAKPGKEAPQRKNRTRFSEEEVADMWLFIIDRLRHPVTQKVLKFRCGSQIWKEFKKENDSPRNELSFYVHFRRTMIPTLDATNFDMQTKTILHYALEIPCTDQFIKELRDHEKVEVLVNENDLITAYRKIKSGHFHEDDGWDEVWGEEVSPKKGDGPGSTGNRFGRQNEGAGPSQNSSQWNSVEKSHLENSSDSMLEKGENGDLDVEDDSDEYGKEPKRKKQKTKEKRGRQPKKIPGEHLRKRKERKEMLLAEQVKQKQDQKLNSGAGRPSIVANNEDPADFDDLRQNGSSSSLLQLEQSWASVYTPLDSFDQDGSSSELGNYM